MDESLSTPAYLGALHRCLALQLIDGYVVRRESVTVWAMRYELLMTPDDAAFFATSLLIGFDRTAPLPEAPCGN